jgi:hypothetical protein
MVGKKNYINYVLSGKWQPSWMLGKNQFAWPSSGHTFEVMASELGFPSGLDWIKGFLGQAIYTP